MKDATNCKLPHITNLIFILLAHENNYSYLSNIYNIYNNGISKIR